MKTLFVGLLAISQAALAQSAIKSPLIGHWLLDVNALPMPPEARPKSVTLDFRNTSEGRLETHVEIIDQNNGKMESESVLALDGTPGAAKGNYWVDICAAKMPSPDTLVMQFAYKGAPASTRIYSLSEDGKVLTETEAFFKKDGTPMMRTATFSRGPTKQR